MQSVRQIKNISIRKLYHDLRGIQMDYDTWLSTEPEPRINKLEQYDHVIGHEPCDEEE